MNTGLGRITSLAKYSVSGAVNLPEGHASAPKGIVLQFPGAEVRPCATVTESFDCSFTLRRGLWHGATLCPLNQTLHPGGDRTVRL